MTAIVIALLAYTLIREVVFHLTTQRLINKLMSRDYRDYVYSQTADFGGKKTKPKEQEVPPRDDIGVLTDFGAI